MKFAEKYGLDANRLISDRQYRDEHRAALGEFYGNCKNEDKNFDTRAFIQACTVDHTRTKNAKNIDLNVVFVTGVRENFEDCKNTEVAGGPVLVVKLTADDSVKVEHRGWVYDEKIDGSRLESECDEAVYDHNIWIFIISSLQSPNIYVFTPNNSDSSVPHCHSKNPMIYHRLPI